MVSVEGLRRSDFDLLNKPMFVINVEKDVDQLVDAPECQILCELETTRSVRRESIAKG